MIIYDLCCDNDHRFEGWFQSSTDFDMQSERGLIRCPQCDTGDVRRVPSVIAIGGNREPAESGASAAAPVLNAVSATEPIKTLYHRLVSAVLSSTEDVGAGFAEEARRIHYQEAPERAIRGQATEQEFDALRDEGIDIIRLPMPRKEDLS